MYSIAIDGPAGSGKSTVAKQIAKKLGILYIDTGAMYRTVGLYCLENNIDFKTAKVRHTELSEEIEKHNYSYYVLDAPTVDDIIIHIGREVKQCPEHLK